MRRVILFMHMTLDGFIARENGAMDWATMTDQEMDKYMAFNMLMDVGTMILGRVLFQGFEKAWPAMAADPKSPKELVDFAHWIEDSPKIVFSKTLDNIGWKNSRLVKVKSDQDIVTEILKLKEQPGKDIVLFGGARFSQTCAKEGLVDEYRFKLEPVALGTGRALFQEIKNMAKLKLIHSKAFDSGVLGLYYQPIR